jgi:hypothetical protein
MAAVFSGMNRRTSKPLKASRGLADLPKDSVAELRGGGNLQNAEDFVHLVDRHSLGQGLAFLVLLFEGHLDAQQHLVNQITGDELHPVVVSKDEIAGEDADVVGYVSGHEDRSVDLGDAPAAEGVRAGAEGVHREIGHLKDVLGVAAVAGQQHAAATVGVGQLAAHLAEVGRLHIAAAVEAEDGAVLHLLDGAHHALLGVTALGLPFLLLFALLFRGVHPVDQGVELDGQGAADQLHALTQRFELVGEDRVLHAQTAERVGDTAPKSGPAEAVDALQIGDIELAHLDLPAVAGDCGGGDDVLLAAGYFFLCGRLFLCRSFLFGHGLPTPDKMIGGIVASSGSPAFAEPIVKIERIEIVVQCKKTVFLEPHCEKLAITFQQNRRKIG